MTNPLQHPTRSQVWVDEFPHAVTVCSADGTITDMNEESARVFAEDGGRDLIGTNILDCHPEPARKILENLLKTRLRNIYTIQKEGKRKLIYQSPWYRDGEFAGLVELSLDLPESMPHFDRDSQ
jgi:transcriptional regulator with PAS, ATPase and Fis domain